MVSLSQLCLCVRRYVPVSVLLLPGAFGRGRPSIVHHQCGTQIRKCDAGPLDQERGRSSHESGQLKAFMPLPCVSGFFTFLYCLLQVHNQGDNFTFSSQTVQNHLSAVRPYSNGAVLTEVNSSTSRSHCSFVYSFLQLHSSRKVINSSRLKQPLEEH